MQVVEYIGACCWHVIRLTTHTFRQIVPPHIRDLTCSTSVFEFPPSIFKYLISPPQNCGRSLVKTDFNRNASYQKRLLSTTASQSHLLRKSILWNWHALRCNSSEQARPSFVNGELAEPQQPIESEEGPGRIPGGRTQAFLNLCGLTVATVLFVCSISWTAVHFYWYCFYVPDAVDVVWEVIK